MAFAAGATITKREVWGDRAWLACPVRVDSDDGDAPGGVLAVVLEDGAPFTFDDLEPVHPWAAHDAWRGPTVLQLRRPGDWYSVWKFFGPASEGHPFRFWYLNIERPVVRTPDGRGIDTDDLELDLVVDPDGTRHWKDVEYLTARLAEARFDVPTLLRVLDTAATLTDLLDRDDRWWAAWDDWAPGGEFHH
ncbi:hypothetical protein BH09ACT12_BH09ACT12_23460 [soil metagenome]